MTTANTTTCTRCTRPVADGAHCCTACVAQTDANMEFLEANAGEIETTLTRQDRVSAGTGGRVNAETPLPINLTASDIGHRLRNTLTTWTRLVADDLGTSIEEAFCEFPQGTRKIEGPVCTGRDGTWCTHPSCRAITVKQARRVTDRDMAAWLRKRLKTIAHREWGPECFDGLSRCAVDLARAIDSPPPMIALGRCDTEDCDGELRTHQEATWVKCRDCGESYDVARRKEALIVRAGARNMTAAKLARVLTAANFIGPDGRPVVCEVKNVYNWVQRKHLIKRGTDIHTGKPTYSFAVAWAMHEKTVQRLFTKAAKDTERLESQAA